MESDNKNVANSTQTSGVKKHLTPVSAPSTPIENASAVIAIDSAIPSLSDPNLKTRSTVTDPIDATVAAPETALAVPSKTLVITGGETPVLTSNNLYAPTANAVNQEDATVAQLTEKQVAPFAMPATTGGEIHVLASANPYARAALAQREVVPASNINLEKPPDWKGKGIAYATQDSYSDQSSDIEPDSSDTLGRTPASGSLLEGTPVQRIPARRNPGSPLWSFPDSVSGSLPFLREMENFR
ncbi:hypothetical protein F2Q69_00037723 [Brassica cretica]|uniref:Uncharacterized protein n=1 Tax=Brassica cretica TaxID=69181 RepID=A0A8S9SQC2_BRACR|nr:hypothetical protein F2Q69_00037723 [Brassica cretica]